MNSRTTVCLLGATGAGKSSLLAGLALASAPDRDIPLHAHLEELAAALAEGDALPEPPTEPLAIHVDAPGGAFDAEILDYPGDLLDDRLRRMDRAGAEPLLAQLAKASHVLVLLDPETDLATPGEIRDDRQAAILTALAERKRERRAQPNLDEGLENPPLAVIVTKADRFPALRTPGGVRAFVEAQAPAFASKLTRLAGEVRYFAVSAHGVDGQPWGLTELFSWLAANNIRTYTRLGRRIAVTVAACIAGVAAGGAVWIKLERDRGRDIIFDNNLSKVERIERTTGTLVDDSEARIGLLRERLEEIDAELAESTAEPRLAELAAELQRLVQAQPGSAASRLAEVQANVRDRREVAAFTRLREHAERQRPGLDALVAKFDADFPGSKRRGQIDDLRRGFFDRANQAARDRVRLVAASDGESLANKAAAIVEYLNEFSGSEPDAEAKRMRRAAELGAQFAKPGVYKVRFKRSGNFAAPRVQHVKALVDGELVREEVSASAATVAYWDKGWFNVRWACGQSVEAMLVSQSKTVLNFGYYRVAGRRSEDPLALRALAVGAETVAVDGWEGVFAAGGPLLELEIEGLANDDWQAAADYLWPGSRW